MSQYLINGSNMQLNVLSFVIFKECANNIQWCNVQRLNGALCCPQKNIQKNPPPCYTVNILM